MRPMNPELLRLWNFDDPAESERRFADAIAHASAEERIVLRIQIARTHGLRRDFEHARRLLDAIAEDAERAGPLAAAHHAIELGRSFASATHRDSERTSESDAAARTHFERAERLAGEARDDALRIDALHMLAFADRDAESRIGTNLEALAVALGSEDPRARRWEASIRHNLGCELHAAARFEEALAHFEAALSLRVLTGGDEERRIARWMVGWTLRSLGRLQEALAIQRKLETECAARDFDDVHVLEELAQIHRELGDDRRAAEYEARRRRATPST